MCRYTHAAIDKRARKKKKKDARRIPIKSIYLQPIYVVKVPRSVAVSTYVMLDALRTRISLCESA